MAAIASTVGIRSGAWPFIRRSRARGFSLQTVRTLLSFVDGGERTCEDVQSMTLAHLDETRRKIADLLRIERVLAGMAANCVGGRVPDCPIVEALIDDAHTEGGIGAIAEPRLKPSV